jgi:hypothetical protein
MKESKYKQPEQYVVDQIRGLFEDGSYEKTNFEFQTKEDGYFIEVSKMYSYVGFRNGSVLSNYQKIATLLGVEDGDEVSRYSYGGCETCDYGSSYEVTLKFW